MIASDDRLTAQPMAGSRLIPRMWENYRGWQPVKNAQSFHRVVRWFGRWGVEYSLTGRRRSPDDGVRPQPGALILPVRLIPPL